MAQDRPTTPPGRAARFAILTILLVAAAAAAPLQAHGASAIGLSAGTFKFSTVHGKTLRGDLYVSNEGDTPIQVLVYTADIVPDAKGVPQFVLPRRSTLPLTRSAASWTTINAPESTRIINNAPYLALGVGKRSHVYFKIDVSPDAPAGDYSEAIFFEMFNLGKVRKGTTSRIGGRLGCRVQVRVQGRINESVSVRPFTVGSVVFGSTVPYDFTIHDDGNIDHYFASTLQLLDADEQVKSEVVVGKADYVYAHSKKVFDGKAPVKGMGLGKYTAELRVSYLKESLGAGGQVARAKTDIVKQRTFYVVPLAIVIPLALTLLAVLLFLVAIPARRRRRAQRQQPGAGGPGYGPPPGGGWEPPPVQPQPPVVTTAQPEAQWEAPPVPPQPLVAEPEPAPARAVPQVEESAAREALLAEEPVLDEPVEQSLPGREEPDKEIILPEEQQKAELPSEEREQGEEQEWKRSWGEAKYYGPPPDNGKK